MQINLPANVGGAFVLCSSVQQFTSLIHLSEATYKAKTYKMKTNFQLLPVSWNFMEKKWYPSMAKKLHNESCAQYTKY